MASISSVYPNAFEYFSEKITELLHNCCPYTPSVNLSSKDAKAVLEKSVHTQLSNVGRLIQTRFYARLGKVATKLSDPSDSASRSSTRKRKSPHADSSLPFHSDPSQVSKMNFTYTDDYMAPPHRTIPIDVNFTPYLRLSPSQMIRISVGDELILVIPGTYLNLTDIARESISDVQSKIDAVMLKSCSGLFSDERKQ